MANPYILRYSNPFKTQTIEVPDALTGSGINNFNTTLELVGPGYTNYGRAFAQNFVKLLENFASPFPPENAIEGQLWYDTSDADRKILRINNGSDTSSRWPSASGVFQQSNDPSQQYEETVSEGDIWVDTQTGQLKIRSGGVWKLVGPNLTSSTLKTGLEPEEIESTTGAKFPVIKNYVNGKVVEIISLSSFIPKVVIDGFSVINTGTNLTSRLNAKYNGLAEKASGISGPNNSIFRHTDFLKSNSPTGQVHTGTFIVSSPDGLQIRNVTYNHLIKINSSNLEGRINFNNETTKFIVGVNNASYISLDPVTKSVSINTTTNNNSTLSVAGSGYINGNLTVTGNQTVSGRIVAANLTVTNNLSILGVSTFSGRVHLGTSTGIGLILDPVRNDVYDIGSNGRRFRHIYASKFGRTDSTSSIFYGNVVGTVERLSSQRLFKINGHVETLTNIYFDGSSNVEFTATITKSAISSQTTATVNDALTFLVYDASSATSVLQKIDKSAFLVDVKPGLVKPGMIMPFSTSTLGSLFPDYLLCNGASYTASNYTALHSVIGTTFGAGTQPGEFNVPNYSVSLTTGTIYFIIKT